MRLKVPRASEGGGVASAVDLSAGPIHSDPGSYLSPDLRTASEMVTNTNGSGSSINVNTFGMIGLLGDVDDGVYVWDLTRTNPGQNDKMGLLLGFYDSADTSRNIMGGLFEATGNRAVNTSTGASVVADTQNTVDRVKASVVVRTDENGDRVIGPGFLDAYSGTTLLSTYAMEETHVVTGTLRKVCAVRRGTSGTPAGDFGYTLTEQRHAL